MEYFQCGKVYYLPDRGWGNYSVHKISDLADKIIPFFIKYPVLGEKAKDFADFCIVAQRMKEKKHIIPSDFEEILLIKAGMNKSRKSE